MRTLLNAFQADAERRGPLDILVWAGCGRVTEIQPWLTVARQIVLVDADADVCESNRELFGSLSSVRVLQALVAPVSGPQPYHRFNFTRFDSLCKPHQLSARYPNAMVRDDSPVLAQTLSDCISASGTLDSLGVVLDLNGCERDVLAGLTDTHAALVRIVGLCLPCGGLYEGEATGFDLAVWAAAHAWLTVPVPAVSVHSAASLPVLESVLIPNRSVLMANDSLQRNIQELMAQRDALRVEQESERLAMARAAAEHEQFLEKLRADHDRDLQQAKLAQAGQLRSHAQKEAAISAELESVRQSLLTAEAGNEKVTQELQSLKGLLADKSTELSDALGQVRRLQTALDQQTLALQERAVAMDKLTAEITQLKSRKQVSETEFKALEQQLEERSRELQDLRVRNQALESGTVRLGQQMLKSEGQLQLIKEMLLGDLQPRLGQDQG